MKNASLAKLSLEERKHLMALAKAAKLTRAVSAEPTQITPIGRETPLPLSFAQQRLWFLSQFGVDSDVYHIAGGVRLTGTLKREALLHALDTILARHEALRTSFKLVDGAPVQVFAAADCGMAVLVHELRGCADQEAELARLSAVEAQEPFDLEHGPLIRARLIVLDEQEHVLLVTMHHIVSDGWSMGVLINELAALYAAFYRDEPDPLPALAIQYADYACWQRQWLQQERQQEQSEYWRQTLSGAPALLELPTDRPRPAQQDFAGAAVPVVFDAALSADLKRFSQRHGVTLYMTLLASWALLLARLSGQDEVVIGSPMAGRGRAELEPLIGFFANTLALRLKLGGAATVAELLQHAKAQVVAAQRHQDLPFEQIVELVQPARSMAHAPLFQVMFAWQNAPEGELTLPGLTLSGVAVGKAVAKFDLSLNLQESGDAIVGGLEYATALFDQPTMERHVGHWRTLLSALVADDAQALEDLPLLSEAQRTRMLSDWNAGAVAPAVKRCVHQLFEEQAARDPSAVALVHEDRTVSYGELNAQANRLAHHLRGLGVGPDTRVAICVGRGVGMMVAVLATLKAGGGYVPLDPAYPQDRLAYMLADSAPLAVLVDGAGQAALAGVGDSVGDAPRIDLAQDAAWQDNSDANPQVAGLSPAHLAYIIYTSGSTGAPKGVMIEHANVVRLFSATDAWFSFGADDVWTLFHSFAFDFSVWEMWGALAHGGQLVIVPLSVARAPDEFYQLLCRRGVTVLNQTPTAFRQLIAAQGLNQAAHRLRYTVFGGEALETSLLAPWYARAVNAGTQLINMYGITETTVHVTYRPLEPADAARHGASPIGRRIPDLRTYILDANRQPVPIGVVGELYVGGAGVARGYLNRPELTAERFLDDPFAGEAGARMYKTGDLGRYLVDGSIDYLGRNDFQVKIRGFRIELGEIEARLSACAGVREAVVLAREDQPGDKRLVAYLIADAEGLDLGRLRQQLSTQLAEYMVPSAFVALDAFPLTPNGKLDQKALPAPDGEAYARRGYEAPRGEAEQALATIWAELLKLEQVGRHDNFFELGGHSLLAVALIERMRGAGLQTDVRTLFSTPTVAALALGMEQGASGVALQVAPNGIADGCQAITPDMLPLVQLTVEEIAAIVDGVPGGAANIQDIYPLTPLQEGILFHHMMGQEGDPYLMQIVCAFDTRERLDSYLETLGSVIKRHDILRTAMRWEGLRQPVQVVWRDAPLLIEDVSAELAGVDVVSEIRERYNPRHYRIDVRQAPLMRVMIAQDAVHGRWVMLWLNHHLVDDNTSMKFLIEEVHAIQHGREQGLLATVPFRNFVAQARLGVSEDEHEVFFRAMLSDFSAATAPYGLQQSRGELSIGESKRMLPVDLGKRLRAQARVLGVTAASFMHLAWAQVLAKLSGQEDVVFGTVLFGRMQGGVGSDRVLGMLINTLPIRIRVGEYGAARSVRETHGALTQLLRHEHAPLALAQRCSAVQAPLPLFSSLLNYRHGEHAQQGDVAQTAWEGVEMLSAEERTNYPFTLSIDDLGDVFLLTAQVEQVGSAARICDYVQTALEGLVALLETAPETPLAAVDVLADAERDQVLYGWNATDAAYPSELGVHQVFEQQVALRPQAVALVHDQKTLSYAELNAQANRLAHHLIAQGIGAGDCVATCLERSAGLVIAQLAILKAGAAYVPLDAVLPPARQAAMLADCGARLVLAARTLALPAALPQLLLDDARIAAHGDADPGLACDSGSAAYVMYTSGSAGTPKGVAVPHRAVHKLVVNNGYVDFTADDKVGFAANPAFDASTMEVWAPLLNGGAVVVLDQDTVLDPARLCAALRQQGVTVLWLTVGLFNQYADALAPAFGGLRYLIVGGDALDPQVVRKVLATSRPRHLLNGYGPTETTTFATTYEIDEVPAGARSIPIGRPIANTQVYVLDARRQPVPVGVAGELYIGGAGVALGYLNLPEMTAERFVPDPFAGVAGATMYKTGDLARHLADGNIEYLGRNDFQVKIRGFRIELGEIETRLSACAGVREAAVLAREDQPGDKRLVAYVVGAPLDIMALRQELALTLADYMVPAAFVALPSLPLTPNGKLDRKALPAPDAQAYVARGYQAPQGETETTLAAIWAELLKLERVGRHDNFFELGGHSLLAVALIERMRRAGVQTDVRALFGTPTIAALAAGGGAVDVVVPANGIVDGCAAITPDMLPLVQLSQQEIDGIVAAVPGGGANIQDIYPLAPLQEGILFHHMMQGEGDAYIMPTLIEFDTRVRLDGFLGSLQTVIDRHDILRTAVLWEGLAEPVQVVLRSARMLVEEIVLAPADGEIAAQLGDRYDPHHYRIDVRQAPLLRAFLCEDRANGRWLLQLLTHHLAIDHTTLEILVEEIRTIQLGREAELPRALPFRNFIAQARLGVSRAEHEAFFTQMLSDIDEPSAPYGLLDVRGDGSRINEAVLRMPTDLAGRLRAQARAQGVSAASLMHLAWAQVLARLSGRRDVVFGTVLFGRMQGGAGSDRVLGMFINTLPLRISVDSQSVGQSVQVVHALLTQLLRHEHASLALAQRCSGVAAQTPLFSSLLNYRHSATAIGGTEQQSSSGWDGVEIVGQEERTNYPLTLSVDDLGEDFVLTVQVDQSISAERVGAYVQEALAQLVNALETRPAAALDALNVLPQDELRLMLEQWNATDAAREPELCLHELFERQAAASPEAVAVNDERDSLSYRQLNERANQLAHHLAALGVAPDVRVAVCAERGVGMVVALLAILKAGGCYVPLDPDYPHERLAYMLADSAPLAVLLDGAGRQALDGIGGDAPRIDLEAQDGPWRAQAVHNLARGALTPSHLAYVIYTSGSTGQPKGAMNAHAGVVNRIVWMQQAYALSARDVVLQKTPFSFDVSVWEFFWPLSCGARLVMARAQGHKDPAYLSETIEREGVTTLHFVPSMLQVFLEHGRLNACGSVTRVVCSGEALPAALAQRLHGGLPGAQLYNLYGPTEAAVDVTAWTSVAGDTRAMVPIGRPIANTRIYLLDEAMRPVPLGVAGELYIGGVQVGRGYLHRPELTAQRFVADPFAGVAEAKLYKTGDLARFLDDGNIEYLGRNDFQVKLRGFRIELGEIEAALAACAGVREAVVLAREDQPGDQRLVAYVAAQDGMELDIAALRAQLGRTLSEFMVPGAFVVLDELPLTPNGKLDRKALPAPDGEAYAARGYQAPQGETETTLAAIWAELLKLERVGRHDNFFELGGHSLLAVALIERMRRAGVQTDVRALFGTPTIAALAVGGGAGDVVVPANGIVDGCAAITPDMLPLVQLSQREIDGIVATVPGGAANIQDIYPLAPLQEGILFHHMMQGEGDAYIMPTLIEFDTRVRLDGFLGSLQTVIDRHDILRTAVLWEGLAEPVQVVLRSARMLVEEIVLAPADGEIAAQLGDRYDPHHYRIDVRQAPLLRAFLCEDRANGRWLLQLLTHHLAIDHTTLEILVEEIRTIQLGREAELPRALPFRNFIAQARLGVSRAEHEAFFTQMLSDIDEPTLPYGLLDVRGDGSRSGESRQLLPAELALQLRAQARAHGVSAASLMHLAWAQVLARLSGRQDVVFGTVLFGRMQGGAGSDRVLGMFINTLPVRISTGAGSVAQGLRGAHTMLTQLLRHEHASLALAQRCSGVAAQTPLFSSLLNYRHSAAAVAGAEQPAGSGWEGVEIVGGEEHNNYPLSLSVDDLGEGFMLTAQADQSVSPARVCSYMQTALESLVALLETAPETPLAAVDVLADAERDQVLYGWNASDAAYPSELGVHQVFEQQVALRPQAVALVHDQKTLSYAALNAQANRLAHHLIAQGIGAGDCVATCLERSAGLVIAQLAILKAGATYVPLDAVLPPARQAAMLADCGARLVLAARTLALPAALPQLLLDDARIAAHGDANPGLACDSGSAAYVMYTSGSAGTPKGVAVPHRAVHKLVVNNGYVDFTADDKVGFAANPAFDASTMEVWAPLLNGGAVVVLDQDTVLDPARLCAALRQQGVTVLWLTVGLFNQYADALAPAFGGLRYLIVGGDALDPQVVRKVLATSRPRHLLNGYGPTETTTFATTYEIDEVPAGARSIPIGRPIANTQVYVLDARRQPVPVGVAGELYIGGAGVALGYLNLPEMTEERFVPDPFAGVAGATMYKTGDLARHLADGNLEYLGRNDFQVKIRGFRIELGEIEARLSACAGVREAAVLAREDQPGDKRLVAYVVGAPLDITALREELALTLSDYMVPAAFVALPSLPLTPNGKLDRKALPAPDAQAYVARGYEAPQGETETVLAAIWAELLKLERVGRHDNFFELGGHSLLAVALIERMRRAGVQTDVRALFGTPTIAALAVGGGAVDVVVPANGIVDGCAAITPDMLPLVQLSQREIDGIVAAVPGGAANIQDIYPLAPLQEGILFHHMMQGEGDAYIMPTLIEFDTRARLDGFLASLQAVIDRHDILRTGVLWEGLAEPVQVVLRSACMLVEEIDLAPADGEIAAQLGGRYDPHHYRIDVRQAPLLRAFLCEDRANGRWLLQLLTHHLAIDHTTLEILVSEIHAVQLGREAELPRALPFRNFIAQARLGVSRAEHEAFFTQMLSDIDEPTLPYGLLDVRGDGSRIRETKQQLPAPLALQLRAQARAQGVSAASLMHLAWAQVLARLSGRRDVVFGTVLFGRMQGGAGSDRVLGMFINTLPVRISVDDRGVAQGVRGTHTLLTQLLRHEHASLALAQRCSGVAAQTPLFSSLLNYRHSVVEAGDAQQQSNDAWVGVNVIGGEERTNYPLTLSVDDLGEDFVLTVQVDQSISAERVGAYVQEALAQLVNALETRPAAALDALNVLPQDELRLMLEQWNATDAAREPELCLHELFERQAAASPEAVAVSDERDSLSYRQLNERANQLARHLAALGVAPDARVAVCAERGVGMVVALLAILKAGGCYVPLDPDYPHERLAYMLADSAPLAVLLDGAGRQALDGIGGDAPRIDLGAQDGPWRAQAVHNLARGALTPSHLAYVIYTSGSTGQPKGAMNAHAGVVNRIVWMQQAYALSARDVVLQKTPFSFDVSVWEFFWPLSCGARLVMARAQGHKDPAYLSETIEREGVTTLHFVPSMLQVFLEHGRLSACGSVTRVVCSGEALPAALAQRLHGGLPGAQLYNLYGPTEAAVDVTAWTSVAGDTRAMVPIGRPIANTRIYLLDEAMRPVPLGVAGELYIGGVQVGSGYLHRPELTAQRFVADPFAGVAEAKLYKTGDLARFLDDGNIEYLGRNDFQVKLRGFRIELGEIEAALAACAGVREAVVLAREDQPGDQRLVAYVVAQDGMELDIAALRAQLGRTLSEFMVPGAFVVLDELPLTPNGKLDRKALPAPDGDAYAARGYQAPQGETETTLAAIWAELLKLERVGRHDNFFELGGHSLLAVALIERMRRAGVQTDVRALFGTPTIAALAAGGGAGDVVVPANGIVDGCAAITPDMLPLVQLSQREIDGIVATVPGGAANIQDIYPLAPLQEGILFHHMMQGEGDAYIMPTLIEFDTRVRLDGFLGSLQTVIDRHDILRTAVLWEGLAEPVQVVLRSARMLVEEVELAPADGEIAAQLGGRYDPHHYRIDVRQAPLLRAFLCEDRANGRWLLQLLTHHLAIDHTTLEILVEEIRTIQLGREADLPRALPFRNFIAQARLGVSRAEHEAFFTQMLSDIDEPTAPYGLLDVRGDGSQIGEARQQLPAVLARRLRAQARAQGVSPASLMHLAWAQVLARLSGRQDVVFGTVLLGRMQAGAGADRVLGMFINTLPVRISIDAMDVAQGVRRAHTLLTQLLRHEHASLALAQRCSGIAAQTPLFSSLMNYRHSASAAPGAQQHSGGDWEGVDIVGGEERTNYPLTLSVDDLGEDFLLTAQVDQSVSAERICDYLQTALEGIVAALETAPQTALAEIGVLSAAERRQVLVEWNATAADYEQDVCLHELFERQAERTPHAVALVHEQRQVSYAELNAQANRLAHHLLALGVAPDVRVAICAERGVEMLVAMLATLKAGGCYVPLDPAYPRERLAYMLADSAPLVALSVGAGRAALDDIGGEVARIDLREQAALWSGQPSANPQRHGLTPAHLAYVIYTSGSTGAPKGVMIEQRNAVNFVHWARDEFDADTLVRTLASTSLNFDLAMYECFVPLSMGLTVTIVANALSLLTQAVEVSLINTVPSAIDALVGAGAVPACVGAVNLAGEALKRSLVEKIFAGTGVATVRNLYGPSETTTYSTWVTMTREQGFIAHIGRPVANTQVYILDARRQPVPAGVAGELYIGGAGVARGYLNLPQMTEQRFLPDPFAGVAGARMYKTGDLGRHLADGNIEYLGRNDFQVKIRGFRIELGEIETKLSACAGVREAVVLAREDQPGDKRLVAYLLARDGAQLDVAALRAELARTLSEVMLPGAYVVLDAFPLTPNGKLDRKALPAPDGDAYAARGYEAPQGQVEETLAAIWAELLQLERVGRHDNFFELGGHSLLATRLVARLGALFGRQVPLRLIFDAPTLAAQAEAAGGLASALPAIAPVPEQDHYPLSHAQRRLWLMSQIVNAEAAYNVGMAVRLRGALDREKMAQALSDMIARHAPLRSTFITVDGVPMQWPGEALPVELPLTHSDIGSGDPLGDAREALRHFTNQAFNLETGPLLRARLLRLGDDDHVLALVVHHIVADGWSLEVIVGELSASYDALCQHGQARELAPPLSVQYADYALWEKQMLDSGALTAQRDYWLERLGSHLAILQLPTDRARPLVHSFAGARHVTPIDARLGAAAQALAARHGLTPYMLLLAVYQVLLYRLSGQTDILVGTPLAGRHHPQVGEMIGLFVNTLVMRVDLSDDPSFLALMARVRGDTLDAYTNQDYPFDLLVEELSARRDLSRQSIFDTTFTLHNVAAASPARRDIAGLVVEPFELDDSAAKFDLSATVTLDGDAMSLALQYSSELFDPATIARFGSYYVKLLEEVVAAPQTPVSRLRLLGDAERRQLLALSAGADVDTAGAVVDDLAARFARQAAASAAASAVRYEGQSLSYAELDARANRLANYLAGKGVGAESPVVLCLERSLDMIVAILAVLKAGGCYVPMEPGAPDERLAYVLADCGARHAIGHGAHSARLAALLDGAVCLDAEAAAIEACAATAPSPGVDPQRSAYVIYTSGSTGQPKGVQLTHANVLRLFSACARHFDFDHDQVWTMFHSYAFDFSVWEIFGALLHGGRLVVVPQAVTRSPQAFTQLLAAEQVTMLSQTPSAFLRLLEGVAAGLDGAWAATLRYVVFGGEALEYGSLRPWFRNGLNPGTALINMYGITETTVHVTWKEVSAAEVEAGGASDVGRPLADLYCYILDAHREPVPAGVTGELYVGGAGLARGYLNRPELNAERFLANPFVGQPSARLYRSGDLARWSATGGIDYLGRIDHQVKIHGYRIELGEIEAALGRHAGVSACVVLAVKDVRQLQDKLVAYYSAADSLTASALRAFLGQTLPEYMLPSAFVHIAEMPLTINGKIDRSKLKSDLTLRPALDVVYRAPQTSMQIRLANIWGEVLGVSQVGLHDNFFDLGGDSFSAYRLMARILDDLGRDLPLEAIFKMQTIAELELALLDEEGSVAVNSLVMLTPGAPGVRPFFCIHPAGGDVLGFQPLARTLGPRRPFYGLQSPGRFLGESSFYSLEEMATGYLHDILSVQPQGPYLLGGHSMGGKVAYEICRQMEALGHEVAVLAIFDSNIIERASPMVDSLMLLSDIFQLNITREGLLAHQERHMIDHVLKVAKKKFARMLEIAYELDVLPRGFRTKDAEAFLSRIATNIHLSSAYVAQPINTPISLFLASEMTENGDFIDQESWRKVALSGLTVIECPGNHVSLVNYPHVATLAPVLAGIIEQAELRIDAAQAGEGEAVNAE